MAVRDENARPITNCWVRKERLIHPTKLLYL